MQTPWFEYFIVVASLVATVLVGLYFSKGESSMQDYMLGSRKMSIIPISLSIVATYLSGATMVSTAQEVYLYGLQLWVTAVVHACFGCLFAYTILPVSYSVKSASTFEFFDRRFKKNVRKYASLMYAMEMVFHTAISQYVPAASLSQATGFPIFPTACVLSIISWMYTASGGFRAVTYADSFQAVVFISVIMILFFVGIGESGGISKIWQLNDKGYRMEFIDLNTSYSLRYSLLLTVITNTLTSSRAFLSPSLHQRVVAMPSYEHAKKATIWSSILTGLCLLFTHAMGLVVYAYFAGCDPVLDEKDISSYATILPYFVSQISNRIPGITGLFLSGVIAAGLSTTTSCWNTVSCTLYEDVVTLFLPKKISKKTSLRVVIFILFLFAVVSTCCIFVIEHIPSILEATVTMKSFTLSSSITLYICGMMLPWINATGAITGSVVSAMITAYIAFGSQTEKLLGHVVNVPKVLTTADCLVNGTTYSALNATKTMGFEGFGMLSIIDPDVPWYFKISFALYSLPGIVMGLIAAFVVSYLTGFEDLSKIDREMIIPSMRWVLPSKTQSEIDEMESNAPLNHFNVI